MVVSRARARLASCAHAARQARSSGDQGRRCVTHAALHARARHALTRAHRARACVGRVRARAVTSGQRNNYSSGRNEDRLISPNGGNIEQAWAADDMPGAHRRDALPIHGSEGSFNLNSMLLENIRSADYFKTLSAVRQWDELIDLIYYDVKPEYGCASRKARKARKAPR